MLSRTFSRLMSHWMSRPCGMTQGHLVFQFNPDKGQSLYRLGSQPTASSRNVRMACPPEQANRGVAKGGHNLGNVATAHLRAVLIERHIADPMRLVLNLPLPSYQGEQALGGCPLGAQARDTIHYFHPFLARLLEHHVTAQLKDLRQPGPIAVAYEGLTRREIALLDAPMAQVDRPCRSL